MIIPQSSPWVKWPTSVKSLEFLPKLLSIPTFFSIWTEMPMDNMRTDVMPMDKMLTTAGGGGGKVPTFTYNIDQIFAHIIFCF